MAKMTIYCIVSPENTFTRGGASDLVVELHARTDQHDALRLCGINKDSTDVLLAIAHEIHALLNLV